jgi:hypothetical protein
MTAFFDKEGAILAKFKKHKLIKRECLSFFKEGQGW